MLCTTSSEMGSPSGRASQLGEAICAAAATIPARSTYRRRAALGREWEAIEGEIGVGNSQRACAHYKTTFSRCIGAAAFVANTMANSLLRSMEHSIAHDAHHREPGGRIAERLAESLHRGLTAPGRSR